MKPYSAACENNKAPILDVLKTELAKAERVLEIGSGTGQHAVYFGQHLSAVEWLTSDLAETHSGINAWLAEYRLPNVRAPIELDVNVSDWKVGPVDAVFTANTVHIIPWSATVSMFHGVARVLRTGGRFLLYGPFNFNGHYTSESNARFDALLKSRDPDSGIRDFEALDALAQTLGLCFRNDYSMPANNRILVWQAGPGVG